MPGLKREPSEYILPRRPFLILLGVGGAFHISYAGVTGPELRRWDLGRCDGGYQGLQEASDAQVLGLNMIID